MCILINQLKKEEGLKIHHSSCGNCAWGTRKIGNSSPGKIESGWDHIEILHKRKNL